MEIAKWLVAAVLIVIPLYLVWKLAAKNGLLPQAVTATFLFVIAASGFLWLDISSLRGDESTYYQESVNILGYLRNGEPFVALLPDSKQFLSAFTAVFFYISLPSPYLAVLFLTPVFVLIPIFLAMATKNFYNSREAMKVAGWISIFAPQVLLWSPWFRREIISFFALSLSVYGASLLLKKSFTLGTIVSVMSIVIMALTRIQLTWMLLFLFAAVGAILLTECVAHKRPKVPLLFMMFTISATFLVSQYIEGQVSTSVLSIGEIVGDPVVRENIIGSFANNEQNLSGPREESESLTEAPQSPLAVLVGETWLTVRNIGPSLIGPFPAEWKNTSWVLAGLDGMAIGIYFLIVVCSLFLPGFSNKPALALLASTTPLIGANAIALSNYGLASRVRSNLLIMLVPILAITFTYFYRRWKDARIPHKESNV